MPLSIYKGLPQDYQNALLDDAFVMMEHGKMSLPEALRIRLSFAKMYRDSNAFNATSNRLENERLYKSSVVERLNTLIKVVNGRR